MILRNAIRTPDGTVLDSRYRHDYQEHTDLVTGETYSTDGGTFYICRSINQTPAVELDLYLDDPIEKRRAQLSWGTYGVNGDQPLSYVLVKDMSDSHLEACIVYPGIHPGFRQTFIDELEYRKMNQ